MNQRVSPSKRQQTPVNNNKSATKRRSTDTGKITQSQQTNTLKVSEHTPARTRQRHNSADGRNKSNNSVMTRSNTAKTDGEASTSKDADQVKPCPGRGKKVKRTQKDSDIEGIYGLQSDKTRRNVVMSYRFLYRHHKCATFIPENKHMG